MSLSFHVFDPRDRNLAPASGAVESYPGGDVAVRHLQPAPGGTVPVAWNAGGTLDYAALAQWVAFHTHDQPAYGPRSCEPILVMPYLPSARGDRDRTRDAQAAARLTAATGARHVIAADPHSDAWADAAADWGLTVHAVTAAELIGGSTRLATDCEWEWDAVIAPDAGAVTRAGAVAHTLGVPLLTAGKVRDQATGQLSGFTAPEGIGDGRFLVVDDICDGGGTFAGLAQAIATVAPSAELHLWVTHGLFTGRWRENLLPNFASITSADTTPAPSFSPHPYGIRSVRLLPHVLVALANLTITVAA